MEIKLTQEEKLEFFHNALCNGLGSVTTHYGIEFDYDDEEYATAREKLRTTETSPCREDVWMQILKDGGKLHFNDIEGEGENTRSITIEDVYNKIEKTPCRALIDMVEEQDDAFTADAILQTVIWGEIIFG